MDDRFSNALVLPEFYQEPEKCWEKAGGSTEKEWNDFLKFGCWKCQFSSVNFIDFIKK